MVSLKRGCSCSASKRPFAWNGQRVRSYTLGPRWDWGSMGIGCEPHKITRNPENVAWNRGLKTNTSPSSSILLVLLYLNICLFQMHCGSSWLEVLKVLQALFFCGFLLTRVQGFYDQTPRKQSRTASKQSLVVVDLIHVLPPAIRSSPGRKSMDSPLTKSINLKPWKDEDFPYFHEFQVHFFFF